MNIFDIILRCGYFVITFLSLANYSSKKGSHGVVEKCGYVPWATCILSKHFTEIIETENKVKPLEDIFLLLSSTLGLFYCETNVAHLLMN